MTIINQKKRKILVIGLDMGDGALIRKWTEEGYLPTFNRMIEEGKWANLRTPAEVLHVSAWPSLYTGTLPGKHGVYYTYQPTKAQQIAKRIGIGQYGRPPIWKILDQSGMRCVVMDAPYTFPEEGYNGKQIFEWGTWAWYWQPMAIPANLWKELKSKCGSYPLGYEANQIGLAAVDPEKLRDQLIVSTERKANAVSWLIGKEPWDFAWIVFGETHPAGHYLWNSNGSQSSATKPCRDVYQAVDSAIGQILDSIDEDVTVFIVSGDGIGINRAGWHLLPEIMKKAGLLVEPGASNRDSNKTQTENRAKKNLLKRLRGLVPENFRQMVSKKLPSSLRDRLMSRWATADVDWRRTRAYCLPTDLEGCIRINLKGREPEGIVEPGDEYTKICEEICQLLHGLINVKTGRKVVKEIHKIDEVFPGERRDDLPDIVVQWSDEAEIEEIDISEIGRVTGSSPDPRSGTHHPPGFILACGSEISHGDVLSNCHVVGFAPTILNLMGLSVPGYMDGQVWEELF